MTVKELITDLLKYPMDADVGFHGEIDTETLEYKHNSWISFSTNDMVSRLIDNRKIVLELKDVCDLPF